MVVLALASVSQRPKHQMNGTLREIRTDALSQFPRPPVSPILLRATRSLI